MLRVKLGASATVCARMEAWVCNPAMTTAQRGLRAIAVADRQAVVAAIGRAALPGLALAAKA